MKNNHSDNIFDEISKRFKVTKSDLLTYHQNNPQLLELHTKDGMLAANSLHYFLTGFEAANKCYKIALKQGINCADELKVLDLPCGFGRVTRWLRFFFKNATLYVSDIMSDAQLFCSTTFNAIQINCSKKITDIPLPSEIDLIFVGSLFTHLPKPEITEYLRLFRNNLSKQGLCIFTTHGTYVEERLLKREKVYGLDENGCNKILSELHFSGFGFSPYPKSVGYGISIFRDNYMFKLIGEVDFEIKEFYRKGWDNHQDLICVRSSDQVGTKLDQRFCSVCQNYINKFAPYNGRTDSKCPKCASLERHRLLTFLYKKYAYRDGLVGKGLILDSSRILFEMAETAEDNGQLKYFHINDPINLFPYLGELNENDKFSSIIVLHFLGMFPDLDDALRKLYESLSIGGLMIITEPQHNHFTERILHPRRVHMRIKNRAFGKKDFNLYLQRVGFSVKSFSAIDLSTVLIEKLGILPGEVVYFCYK